MRPEIAVTALFWVLVVVGGMAVLAVVPMAMPTAWMEAVNDRMGLGPFPRAPLTEYLTRSLSALYAMVGGFVLYLGFNVRRCLPLIALTGWLTMAFGAALTAIDFAVGMPASWSWGEGPPTILIGVAVVWLARRAGPLRLSKGAGEAPG